MMSQTRTFTAVDECLNEAVPVEVTVMWKVDTEAPVIQSEDYAVCEEELPYDMTVSWTDNCSGAGELTAVGVPFSETVCEIVYSYSFTVTDDCGNTAEKTIYVTRETIKYGNCETAFAKLDNDDAHCFIGDYNFNRWGWTNQITEEGDYTLPIYAGAGQCDISKGALVGNVVVSYWSGKVTVEYMINEGYAMSEAHIYVGCDPYPTMKNGKPTVAPGQFTFNGGALDHVNGLTAEFTDIQGAFYVIAHAVTCEVICSCGQSEGPIYATDYDPMELGIDCTKEAESVSYNTEEAIDISVIPNGQGKSTLKIKTYPNPFGSELRFEFTPNQDGDAIIQIFDLNGSLIDVAFTGKVQKGVSQIVRFDGSTLPAGHYMYKFLNNKQIITGKLVKNK